MATLRVRLIALVFALGGLFWTQQLIASNAVPVCSLLWPGAPACLDNGSCCPIPGQCTTNCEYNEIIDDCECK